LTAPIAVQDHTNFATAVADSLRQCIYGKLSVDAVAVDAGDYSAIIQIYDRAVVTPLVFTKMQICEVHTPFAVALICAEVLLQKVTEYLIRRRALGIAAFALARNRSEAKLLVHIFMNCTRA